MKRASSGSGGIGRAAAAGALLGVVTVAVVSPPTEASSRKMVIAHRGDRAAAPENTNAAFRGAIARGVNAIEMDVRFSRTAYPVIMHDATLDRTTNCSGPVSAYSRTQMRGCDAGSSFASRFRGERIPTLNTALRTVSSRSKSVKVLLHVKELPDATRARHTMEAVRRFGMAKRTIIIADAPAILARMKMAGFTELGLVFSTPAGWSQKYEYMIPYDTPLDARGVAATHRRGGKVWPVGGHPTPLESLLQLTSVDGVLVDRLAALVEIPRLPLPPVPPVPELPALVPADTAPVVTSE